MNKQAQTEVTTHLRHLAHSHIVQADHYTKLANEIEGLPERVTGDGEPTMEQFESWREAVGGSDDGNGDRAVLQAAATSSMNLVGQLVEEHIIEVPEYPVMVKSTPPPANLVHGMRELLSEKSARVGTIAKALRTTEDVIESLIASNEYGFKRGEKGWISNEK